MQIKTALIISGIILACVVFYYFTYANSPCSISNISERVISLTEVYTPTEKLEIAKQVVAGGLC